MTETENSVDGVVLSPFLKRWLDDVTSLWEKIGKRDARIAELEAQVGNEQHVDPAVVEELNRRNSELANEVAGLVSKAEALRSSIGDLKEKLARLAEARDDAVEEARVATEAGHAAASRISELDTQYQQDLAKVTEKARVDLLEADHQAELAREKAQADYSAMQLDLTTQLSDQADAHQLATDAAREKAEQEAAEARLRHERETAAAQESHEREVSRLVREHEDEVAALVRNHNAIVDAMQRRYDALDEYVPVIASENQQIGKTKGIAVASAYIDAAKAEDADMTRVKSLASGIVPAVLLAEDPRTVDYFAEPATQSDPLDAPEWQEDYAKAVDYVAVSVDGFNDGFDEHPDADTIESEQETERVEEARHDDEDDFASDHDDSPALPPFNPEPAQEQYEYEQESALPPFNPESVQWEEDDEESSLPPFIPESSDEDEGSSLPAFRYEPEEAPLNDSDDDDKESEEFTSSDNHDVIGNGDFAFARKLQ